MSVRVKIVTVWRARAVTSEAALVPAIVQRDLNVVYNVTDPESINQVTPSALYLFASQPYHRSHESRSGAATDVT